MIDPKKPTVEEAQEDLDAAVAGDAKATRPLAMLWDKYVVARDALILAAKREQRGEDADLLARSAATLRGLGLLDAAATLDDCAAAIRRGKP